MTNPISQLNFGTGQEMQFIAPAAAQPPTLEDTVFNSVEIYNHRLNTCLACEFVTENRQCLQCSCPVVMMAQFNFKKCPKGYW